MYCKLSGDLRAWIRSRTSSHIYATVVCAFRCALVWMHLNACIYIIMCIWTFIGFCRMWHLVTLPGYHHEKLVLKRKITCAEKYALEYHTSREHVLPSVVPMHLVPGVNAWWPYVRICIHTYMHKYTHIIRTYKYLPGKLSMMISWKSLQLPPPTKVLYM